MRAKSACFFLIIIWAYAAWPTIVTMLQAYRTGGYDYQGFFALPLFYALLVQQRSNLKRIKLAPSPWSLLLLLLCAVLWLFGTLTTLTLVSDAALISMLPIILLATCGRKICITLAYPLLALFLLLPFGKPLFNLLQNLYSQLMLYSLALSKTAIYWENSNILVAKQEYSLDKLCSALQYSSLYLSFGFAILGYTTRGIFKRILMAAMFVILPLLVLFISSFSLILFSVWRNSNSYSDLTINILSWASVAAGLTLAMLLSYAFRSKAKNTYKNDGIDWHNEFSIYNTRWMPATVIAAVVILALPSAAHYLQNRQHFATNWHDPATIMKSDAVTLTINYDHQLDPIAKNDNNKWQQIKHKNIKVAVNGKVIPVTETISINKYQGKITWSMNYTNGHLTNNKTYTKILENMYALSKKGAKTAEIALVSDLGKNLQTSRSALTNALGDLQKNATTTWLNG
jgi:exosortase